MNAATQALIAANAAIIAARANRLSEESQPDPVTLLISGIGIVVIATGMAIFAVRESDPYEGLYWTVLVISVLVGVFGVFMIFSAITTMNLP